MIDLHTHSTASDGTLSPSELVRHALEKNIQAIALTDHDTVEGLEEALAEGISCGVEVVPGIEISALYPNSTLHILGYYIDHHDDQFQQNISTLQKARKERNPKIIKKLQNLGISIELEEVITESKTGQVGRPHFAQVLLKKGYVKNTRQAFEKYLKKGAPAYADKFRYSPRDAIAHIRDCRGIPVLAHPKTLDYHGEKELESIIVSMIDYGLMGIEAFYTEHSKTQNRLYERIAKKYNLLVTGGTDFHGKNIKGIHLGSGRGDLDLPYSIIEDMKKARSSFRL